MTKEKPLAEKRIDSYHGFQYSEEDVKEAVENFEKDMMFKKPNEEIVISTQVFNQMTQQLILKHFGNFTEDDLK